MASRIVPFLFFGIVNFAGLAIGGMATGPGVASDWYAGLAKAPWTPPGWVFGAAWTTVMLGFTWFMTSSWTRAETAVDKKGQALWFGLAWVLNVAWNPLFFGMQATGLALIEILSLYAVIAVMAARNWSAIGAGRWGVVPYLVWLAIATSLNAYIVWANGSEARASQETASVGWTVRDLMTHTSGISYGEIGDPRFEVLYDKHDIVDLFPRDERTTRENARKIASTCLIHSPGSQWNYS